MKIRNGFVSNSSSSSFIIGKKQYKDTFSIAEKMIPMREWENDDDKLLDKIKILRENNLNFYTPISFLSCNYDTYIYPTTKYYVIMTCNNHPFYQIFGENQHSMYDGSIPSEIKEELKEYNKNEINYLEDLDCAYYGKEFLSLENGVYFVVPYDNDDFISGKNEFCKTHYQYPVKIKNEKELCCLHCYIEKNPEKNIYKNPSLYTTTPQQKINRFKLMDF